MRDTFKDLNMDNSKQLKHWLTLRYLPSLGDKRLADLYKITPNPQHLLDNAHLFPEKAKNTYRDMQRNAHHENWYKIDENLKWADAEGQTILSLSDKRYPKLLKHIDTPPILLWVKGNTLTLNNMQIAVVGSRACTASGIQITQQICEQLAKENIQLISGGALGIDTIAHTQCIKNNQPTIAVLGTGINKTYPKQNYQLFNQIEKNGALISEFPLHTTPSRFNFPKRNRIISALSCAVLIIEAHKKSGSLITARLALEQNKEVMAVPGSPLSQASQGCNELISQGAHLIQSAQDILNILNWRSQCAVHNTIPQAINGLNKLQTLLISLINDVPQPIEILAHLTQIEFHQAQEALFELELKGIISREIGGFIRG